MKVADILETAAEEGLYTVTSGGIAGALSRHSCFVTDGEGKWYLRGSPRYAPPSRRDSLPASKPAAGGAAAAAAQGPSLRIRPRVVVPGLTGIRLTSFHKYEAKVSYNGKQQILGKVETIQEAVDLYNMEAKRLGKPLNVLTPEHRRAAAAAATVFTPDTLKHTCFELLRRAGAEGLVASSVKETAVAAGLFTGKDSKCLSGCMTRVAWAVRGPVPGRWYHRDFVESPTAAADGCIRVGGLGMGRGRGAAGVGHPVPMPPPGCYSQQQRPRQQQVTHHGETTQQQRRRQQQQQQSPPPKTPRDPQPGGATTARGEGSRAGGGGAASGGRGTLVPVYPRTPALQPCGQQQRRAAATAAATAAAAAAGGKTKSKTTARATAAITASRGDVGSGWGAGGGTSISVPPPPPHAFCHHLQQHHGETFQQQGQQQQQQWKHQPHQHPPPAQRGGKGEGDAPDVRRMMDKIAALERYNKALQSQNEMLLSSAGALARQVAHG